MIAISEHSLDPIRNDTRYEISVKNFRVKSNIVYEIIIFDLGLKREHKLFLRFSQLKKFHDVLLKSYADHKALLPEFPKTNSFGFWNKTNNDHRKIEDRRRELEFYFTKLLNDPISRGWKEVRNFVRFGVNHKRLTKSLASRQQGKKPVRTYSLNEQHL